MSILGSKLTLLNASSVNHPITVIPKLKYFDAVLPFRMIDHKQSLTALFISKKTDSMGIEAARKIMLHQDGLGIIFA
jgi:hypothetical protein